MSESVADSGLSVVIASFRGVDLVRSCVEAMTVANSRVEPPVEVFLARHGDGGDVEDLARGRSWLTIVPAGDALTIPELRGAGMLSADGGWIAVTEDHCLADAAWLEAMQAGVRGGAAVVGGGMGNARPGLVNWGAYFAEYGFFSASRPVDGGPPLLTGANVMYGPEVSRQVAEWAASGTWEDVVHQRLAGIGASFAFDATAIVRQNHTYSFADFCVDRYEHGRDYARVRLREEGSGRLKRLLTIPLLPFVLWWRVRSAARGDDPRMFRNAGPFTLAFLAAWSVGEAAGYIRGPAAPSPEVP